MCLLSLTLCPAYAQGLPAGWTAVSCDASGNPLPQYSNGITGTQSGSVTRTGTYDAIEKYVTANPDAYDTGNYEESAAYYLRPLFLNDGSTVAASAIDAGSSSDLGSTYGMQALNYPSYGNPGFFRPSGYP